MRHFPEMPKFTFVFILVTTFGLAGSAQSDWMGKWRTLREKGDISAQLDFLEKAKETAPESEKPLIQMEKGLLLEKQGKNSEASSAYEEVIKNPGSLAEYAHLYAAKLDLQMGKEGEAKQHFEKLLGLSPNLQLQNEAKFLLARLSLKEGHAAESKKLLAGLERHQRGEGVYPDLLWELARTERKLGNQTLFCKWIKKLFISYPESSNMTSWTSDLANQDFDGKHTQCTMSPEDRLKRIKNLQWAGLSKKAKEEIEELKKTGMDAYEISMMEALYRLHEGEVSEALNILLPYYDAKKTKFEYLTSLATMAARAGESQLAVGSYYAAYQLAPKSKLGKQALYQSAFLSYQFQDYDGASRRFQEFMKVYSNSGLAKDARWHLAWIRYLRGDYEGAYKAFSDMKLTPRGRRPVSSVGNDRINYWMAMTLFRQGQYVDAKSAFENLVKDGGQGYYALASKQRLKKVEALLPKPIRPVLTEKTKSLSRFSATEFMVSMDDFEGNRWNELPVAEESESEENLVLNPLSSGAELVSDSSEPENSDSGHVEVADDGQTENKTSFSNPLLVKRFERARDLMILGLQDWAKWDLYDIERRTTNKDYLKNLMAEYETIEQYHRSSSIAQNAFASLRNQYGIDGVRYLWQHAFPQAYRAQVSKSSVDFQVASELIWGIMKAESSYKRDVVSPVGAIGLMQIMPNTGEKISGLLKEKNFSSQSLFEPAVSIRLGSKYLQRLLKQFDQNFALVAAGYNAGPHRVRGWLASFGQLDLDEFIEHIPFLETRNYVKKVLSNAWVYKQLYGTGKVFLPALSEPLKIRFQTLMPNKETWEDI